jgi:hypothetical protein
MKNKLFLLACALSLATNTYAIDISTNDIECKFKPENALAGCILNKAGYPLHRLDLTVEAALYAGGKEVQELKSMEIFTSRYVTISNEQPTASHILVKLSTGGKPVPGCAMDITPQYPRQMITLYVKDKILYCQGSMVK